MVTRGQLLDAGLTSSAIGRWIGNGRLVLLHRGIYAVGHARLRREGHWLAAVLAAGRGAALSHRDAAALHALLPSDRPSVEVTAAAQRRGAAGVVVHRARLDPAVVTVVEAIAVTTIARTLVDLAAVVPRRRLLKALEEAERSRRLDVGEIEAVLERTRQRRGEGHAAIRAALADLAATGATVTRSVLEERFLRLLAAHAITRPLVNHNLDGIEVDACWPAARLVVELDGWAFHNSRQAFQRDRTRDNVLQAAGYAVLRFTHDDVVRRGPETAARIAGALRRAQAVAATG